MTDRREVSSSSPETELTWALVKYALTGGRRGRKIGRKKIRKILRKLGAEGLDAERVLDLSNIQAD